MKKIFCFILPFVFPFCLSAQEEKPGCADLKNGSFYFYPVGAPVSYSILRTDSMQREINLVNGDTTWLKVAWIDACSFRLFFIKSSPPASDFKIRFYQTHQLRVDIFTVTKDYYTFRIGSGPDDPQAVSDTMWIKPRTYTASRSKITIR